MNNQNKCECCLKDLTPTTDIVVEVGSSWYLNNYYGLYGQFCRDCYDLVSHDAYGVANNPDEYTRIRVMFELRNANEQVRTVQLG